MKLVLLKMCVCFSIRQMGLPFIRSKNDCIGNERAKKESLLAPPGSSINKNKRTRSL